MQTSSGRAPHSGYDVMVRSIPIESGASESPPITIAQSGSFWLNGVALTSLSDGRLLVAYNAEDVGKAALDTNIHAVIADLSQASVSPPFMLTQSTEGEQSLMVARASQRLVTGPQGQVAAAWFGAADPEAGQPQDASAVNLTLHFPRSASSPQASAAGDLPDSRTSRTANTDVRSSDFYEENIPIPPVWDPTWRPQPPLVTPQGDGPDFGFEGVPGTGWTPADPEMAVGPNHIMIITNGQIACFTKEGVNLWRDELENRDGFWGRQRASNYVYDPEVLWDPHTGRFMAMACERNEKFRAFLLFAVSKDDEPETPDDWWKYRIDVTDLAGEDIDSPSMGVNRDYITLTADFFGPDSMLVYIIDKDSVLGGGVPVMASEHIDGTHGYGVPVMWDGETSLQYMIQSMENLHGQNTEVIFHAIDDPFDDYARTTVSLEVPPYRFPSRPPQRGSSLRPLVFEPRFWSCQFRNGSLWAVHHVDPDRVRARWYEFKMNGWPGDGAPTLAQWGEIDFGTNVNTYFASIAVDGEGNAAITYARSSPTEYISMGRALRLAQDPPGTFREGVTVIESNAGDSSGRWGDYCFTQADPAVPGTFWGHHQYNLNGQWRTWVAQYELPGLRLSLNPDPIPWGEMSLATVRGAPPGSDVYLAYSVVGPGASTVPWLDVRLGILEPRLGGVGKASGDGEAVLRLAVAEGYPGLDLWIQAAVTGEASNVVVTQIAD